jgi:hypothetical protein
LVVSVVSRNRLLWTPSSPASAPAASGGSVGEAESVATMERTSPRQTIHVSTMLKRSQRSVQALKSRQGHVCSCELLLVGCWRKRGSLASRFCRTLVTGCPQPLIITCQAKLTAATGSSNECECKKVWGGGQKRLCDQCVMSFWN